VSVPYLIIAEIRFVCGTACQCSVSHSETHNGCQPSDSRTYLLARVTCSPFATVYNVRKSRVGISWHSSCTFAHQIDHFFGMKLQIFESNNQSRIVSIQVLLVPRRPVVRQGFKFRRWVVLDSYMDRFGSDGITWQGIIICIGNQIGAMFLGVWPPGLIRVITLIDSKRNEPLVILESNGNYELPNTYSSHSPYFASNYMDHGQSRWGVHWSY
jgi:hypothetical protein